MNILEGTRKSGCQEDNTALMWSALGSFETLIADQNGNDYRRFSDKRKDLRIGPGFLSEEAAAGS